MLLYSFVAAKPAFSETSPVSQQRPQQGQQQHQQQQQQIQQVQQESHVIADVAALQSLCEANAEFKEHCKEVTQLDKCSRQFTDVCCSCEEEWNEEFEYCAFRLSLFPRIDPSPIPTPDNPVVIEPEPVPFIDEIDPEAIDCEVKVSNYGGSCSGGYSTAIIDASGSTSGRKGGFQYRYRYSCSDGYEKYSPVITDTSGMPLDAPESSGIVYLQVREPLKPAELSCFIEVQVELLNNKKPAVRRCESGVLFNDCSLGCESNYLLDDKFALDGYALEQKRLVQQLGRVYKRAGGTKKRYRKVRSEAQSLFSQNWTVIWKMPDISKTCTSALDCVSISNDQTISTYQAGAIRLFSLTRFMAKRVKKLTDQKKFNRRARSVVRKARVLHAQAQVELSNLPLTASSCNGGGA